MVGAREGGPREKAKARRGVVASACGFKPQSLGTLKCDHPVL